MTGYTRSLAILSWESEGTLSGHDHNPSSALTRWTLSPEMLRDLAIDVRDDPTLIMFLMRERLFVAVLTNGY
ncbi:hypothetical protein [Thalassobium sp. R2A62]|uniref:hypothetical protein n=1 Tax=Thalassobium sp. R2A62 TaxID=633131 RepID=UPI001CBC093F|nr:hypothetical protein [Thalassobium sp. R2A62]